MDYIIVPTSNSNYQSWQCRLLNWSRKKVNQSGKLIFLTCEDEMGKDRPFDVYTDPDVESIHLTDYCIDWEKNESFAKRGEKYWWGAIPNKYSSIEWFCNNYHIPEDGTLLFMDPDMIFLEKIDFKPEENEIIAQRFIHYYAMEPWSNDIDGMGVMYPFCIRLSTLRKIINDYRIGSEEIKRKTTRWESEMWGFDYAVKKNNLKIQYLNYFGMCTAWTKNNSTYTSPIVHYPNEIVNKEGKRIWFKQDYTSDQKIPISLSQTRNEFERQLLLNVAQERSDFLYHLKWNFDDIFKFYDGKSGYVAMRPYPGGFNNIRMSLELGVCIAYLMNKTLVLPPKYNMYLLKDEFGFEDFFDVEDLGISSITFEDFCKLKNIEPTYDAVKAISRVITEPPEKVQNYSYSQVPGPFHKGRRIIFREGFADGIDNLFFDGNLLGAWYQTIFSDYGQELKKLVARHVHYKKELFDWAYRGIDFLGDKTYYAMHVRRNDFQYKNLFISGEEIYNNIKDSIPEGSRLYIATDNQDKQFFEPLAKHYTLYFYEDVAKAAGIDVHYNHIPIIEQLICTRSIMFIGNDYSTLSSYIYRMRGYMNDIEDKAFRVNTFPYSEREQWSFYNCDRFLGNWGREFPESWDFSLKTIFVSVAAYCDEQLIPTLEDLYKTALNPNRVFVGVHIQDDRDKYERLLARKFPNIRIKFTPKEESIGVVWARETLKEELYKNEDYFFQIDAHSRFKNGWDNILVNQIESVPGENIVLSTYPNEFSLEEFNQEYVKRIPTNAPLEIKGFLNDSDPENNMLMPQNKPALEIRDVVDTRWIAGGFIFAPARWVHDVKIPLGIRGKGEEDAQIYLSYLKNWNIKVCGEAVVWHNYNIKSLTGETYRLPNINMNVDNAKQCINELLFGHHYQRTLEDLERFLNVQFKKQ
jgi:hypothetical protein